MNSKIYSENELSFTLRAKFKFKEFRNGQLEVIQHLLNVGSVLCIHPTGFGKSLLYQLPAAVLPGITLVISPLLALMRDQEGQLRSRFGISAAGINSDQTEEENLQVRKDVLAGNVKILFVAPEQLDHIDRFEFLLKLPVDLIVVDEAHCISLWGHDFRPSYRQIIKVVQAFRERSKKVRVLGLTATAESETENDIKKQLSNPDDPIKVFRQSMNRPNLSLDVVAVNSIEKKLLACEQLLKVLSGSGLIYCATRENTELVANFLVSKSINAGAYHAGMEPEIKQSLQKKFLDDHFKALAATNALGMGIDKPNLRFVIHFDIPGSVTAYYQEIGRAGRDGEKSEGILLYDPEDKNIQQYFIDSSEPTQNDFEKILKAISNAESPPNLTAIKRETGLHPTRVNVVLAELLEQGFISKKSNKGTQVYIKTNKSHEPDLSRYKIKYQVKTRDLAKMTTYADQNNQCRMSYLRDNLGDSTTHSCGHCSICKPREGLFFDKSAEEAVSKWMGEAGVEIAASKLPLMSAGIALLDGKQRLPSFLRFMKERSKEGSTSYLEELYPLLEKQLKKLSSLHKILAIVPLPSNTFKGREAFTKMVADILKVPVYPTLLCWKEQPAARQGELENNDQRHHNVHQKMMVTLPSKGKSKGALLLIDDYIGSGNTMKEAVRALRKEGNFDGALVPLTIAAVKWRLGQSGMV